MGIGYKGTIGIIEALLLVTLTTAVTIGAGVFGEATGLALVSMPPNPSAEFLRSIAEFGGALLLAYVVQAAWLAREADTGEDHEGWVGFMTGAGIAGLIAIILALLLAEHRAAGHDNLLDRFGSYWVVCALIILATTVLLYPLLSYHLSRGDAEA